MHVDARLANGRAAFTAHPRTFVHTLLSLPLVLYNLRSLVLMLAKTLPSYSTRRIYKWE
jgi:hypothetical protein